MKNSPQPRRRHHFPKTRLLKLMRRWVPFANKIKKGNIGTFPTKLRNYVRRNMLELRVFLCNMERQNYQLKDRRSALMNLLESLYKRRGNSTPPNQPPMRPNPPLNNCDLCRCMHRLDPAWFVRDWNEYCKEAEENPYADRLPFPQNDY